MPNFGSPKSLLVRLAAGAAVMLGLVACAVGSPVGTGGRAAVAPAPAASAAASADRPVALATFTVLADLASVIGGAEVRVESLTDPGTEVHGYEPSPDDLRRASGADLVLANGLGLEGWLDGLLAPLDLPTVVLGETVDPLPIDPALPDGPVNPHAWMSLQGGQAYVHAVAEAFADLAPGHAGLFADRADAYAAQLDLLHADLAERLARIPPVRRVLVTCEGAFSYLARDAGLDEAYLWPVNAERQGTPRQVASVIDTVRERDVPAVFCESTVAPTAQHQVARETGARFGGVLYVDSLSGPDGPVPTYLDLLRHDVALVVDGLSR